MRQSSASLPLHFAVRAEKKNGRLGNLFFVEGLASIAASFLTVGIFFFTQHQFQWPVRYNLLLAAAQGVFYAAGALSAHAITRRAGRRASIIGLYLAMAALLTAGSIWPTRQLAPILLVCYQFLSACAWPMIESLVAGRSTGRELSRRLGIYNFTWSVTGALVVAVSGLVIVHFPRGVFLIPALSHLLAAILLMANARAEEDSCTSNSAAPVPAHAEEALLRQRRLALWLSRIAMPATYVVIYSLSATLPALNALQPDRISPVFATLAASVWLWTRTGSFVILGLTAWWHTRPKLLLLCSILMLVAFPAGLAPAALSSSPLALSSLLLGQVLLGAGMGIVYTASLYFGMVLSQGSTEHGGYHEALIGVGQILGPGSGAIAQMLWPGNPLPGIAAVTGVIGLCVIAAVVATVRAAQDEPPPRA